MTGVFAGTENLYNAQGYLSKVLEADTEGGQDELSVILETDARGHITQERLANGYTTTRTFDPETGRLTRLTTDLLGISLDRIQDLSYDYDDLGNLLQRQDQSLLSQSGGTHRNLEENFSYDNLNRLTSSQVLGQSAQIITYDGLGNIKSKTGTGNYSYGQNGAGPHAVTTAGSTPYQYDANGNNISGDGRSISYSTFDLPIRLVKGINTVDFQYGADRNRTKRIDLTGGQTTTTLYLGTVEKVRLNNGSYQIKRYLAGGGLWISSYSSGGLLTGTTKQTLVKDHLGSVHTVLSSNSGQVQNQLMSFDAWGQRRNIDSWVNSGIYLPTFPTGNTTTRGFTGHEMVDSLGIIHMNGRIYDAKLGRFLQADPVVQSPTNTQNYNRYSYVLNNPLAYTDPSGYFLKELFKVALDIYYMVFEGGWTDPQAWANLFNDVMNLANAVQGSQQGTSNAAFSNKVALESINTSTGITFDGSGRSSNPRSSPGSKTATREKTVGGTDSEMTGGKYANGGRSLSFDEAIDGDNKVGFKTEKDAARVALRISYERSELQSTEDERDKEYGGIIYQKEVGGRYFYTEPVVGGRLEHDPLILSPARPEGAIDTAYYHTHGTTGNEYFTNERILDPFEKEPQYDGDIPYAKENDINAYLATPSKQFKFYDIRTGEIIDYGDLR